ncbi:MAG: glycosyltransferase family 2 protein [Candidatus Hydrothermarchaeaceae archaeon]
MYTVLVPVYNEEEILVQNTERLAQYLDGLNRPYEIIILSNGSTDATEPKGRGLGIKSVRFFAIPERGVGIAFKKGVSEARGDYIISIDIDLTTDLKFIPEALKLLEGHHIVIGSKKVGREKRSLLRVLLSGGYIFLVKILLGMDYLDYSIGAKAYRKGEVVEALEALDRGSSYVIEIIYRARAMKKKIIEIPVFCEDSRKSKFNLASEVLHRFKNLLRLFFRARIKGMVK